MYISIGQVMQKLKYYFSNPKRLGISLLHHYGSWLPDTTYLKKIFPLYMGYRLNLDNPKTFAEKLQWLKIHDRKKEYHLMVDKVEAKKYIDNLIGPGYTIPTLGIYDSFEQIDWDALPNEFILKATHDSGSYFIVKDKNNFDKQKCKKQLYINWGRDYYLLFREWQYKGLKSRIIAEPLISDPQKLKEYKIFCFNGEPRMYQTCYDRNRSLGGAILNFYDINHNLLDIHDAEHSRQSEMRLPPPTQFEKMLEVSRLLAKNMNFLRVDFFEVEEKVYIGELTLQENAGLCAFEPKEWNYTLGSWLKLPIDKTC